MKRVLFILSLCIHTAIVYAQNDGVASYINEYKNLAIDEMWRTGIPASITLAQGILESTHGTSLLARLSNNHFGIKCHREWKGASVRYDDDRKNECFRSYKDVVQSYIDHSNFLKTRRHYSFLFKFDQCDYRAWAYGLKRAGYATDKKYPQKLIQKIEKYNLSQYDTEVIRMEKYLSICLLTFK